MTAKVMNFETQAQEADRNSRQSGPCWGRGQAAFLSIMVT
jgi:hypothetical protein